MHCVLLWRNFYRFFDAEIIDDTGEFRKGEFHFGSQDPLIALQGVKYLSDLPDYIREHGMLCQPLPYNEALTDTASMIPFVYMFSPETRSSSSFV